MGEADLNCAFLKNSKMVKDMLQSMLSNDKNEFLYVTGAAVKLVFSTALEAAVSKMSHELVYIILPTLLEKKSINSVFLHHPNDLRSRIRISNKAVHNLVVTSNSLLFFSCADMKPANRKLCGVLIKDRLEIKKASDYCHELWENGFPLSYGQR